MLFELETWTLLCFTLSVASSDYTVSFHEDSHPILARFSSVMEVCSINDNKCCVPVDLSDYDSSPRRPFFVSHAILHKTSDPGRTTSDHAFAVYAYPDEACKGEPVERLPQPSSRADIRTRTYSSDGISAIALGNVGADPGLGNTIIFPQRIYVENVLYNLEDEWDPHGVKYSKEEGRGTRTPDLPDEIIGKPFFNVMSSGDSSTPTTIAKPGNLTKT